jgi:hypothetical protein
VFHACVNQASHGKTRQANAVAEKPNWQCLLLKVEQDVKQALAVMDQDSGKMMNYRKLLKHPKFSKAWSSHPQTNLVNSPTVLADASKTPQAQYNSSMTTRCPKNDNATSRTAALYAWYATKS